MGMLDILTKSYLSDNQVFADAFNFLLFDGQMKVDPTQLKELDTTELFLPYGTDSPKDASQKYRDVLKEATISYVGMRDEDAAYLVLGI